MKSIKNFLFTAGILLLSVSCSIVPVEKEQFNNSQLSSETGKAAVPFNLLSWEIDHFDFLATNSLLAGKNGWKKASAASESPKIVTAPGSDREIDLDAVSQDIAVIKTVQKQTAGLHKFSFRVRVSADADSASMAKIYLNTTPATNGWDKKFQIYFGTGFRVHSVKSGTVSILNPVKPGLWYDFYCTVNLNNNLLDIIVSREGANLTTISSFAMDSGPITGLGMNGYRTAGKVTIDDIHGYNIADPSFSLEAPAYQFNFGYYFVDSKYSQIDYPPLPYRYYNYFDEVKPFTDLVYIGGNDDYPNWIEVFVLGVSNAVNAGKYIYLSLGLNNTQQSNGSYEAVRKADDMQRIMNVLNLSSRLPSNWWNYVKYIELTDEPGWTNADEINKRVITYGEVMSRPEYRFPWHPMGANFAPGIATAGDTNKIRNSFLDWASFECYLPAPGNASSSVNESSLRTLVSKYTNLLRSNQSMILVMQAYDYGGAWSNINTLCELQISTYRIAREITFAGSPRLLALTMFSYGRPGGSRAYAQLRYVHRQLIRDAIYR